MRVSPAAAVCVGLTLLGTALSVGVQGQSSRERTLFVSAVDQSGKPVEGLGPEAFDVREDGARREVLRVSRATEPLDVALLVDNSMAASPAVLFLRSSLKLFVARMTAGGNTRIAVIGLADRPTILRDYTADPEALSTTVGGMFPMPGSGMTLLDALTEISNGLARRETPRAAVVAVFTNGAEFGNAYHQDAVRALTRARAPFHAVTIGQFPYGDDRFTRERSLLLGVAPEATGGQQISLLAPSGLDQAMERLAAELKSQYKIVYARPESLIQPEKVRVSSTRPNLVVRGAPARGENGE